MKGIKILRMKIMKIIRNIKKNDLKVTEGEVKENYNLKQWTKKKWIKEKWLCSCEFGGKVKKKWDGGKRKNAGGGHNSPK